MPSSTVHRLVTGWTNAKCEVINVKTFNDWLRG